MPRPDCFRVRPSGERSTDRDDDFPIDGAAGLGNRGATCDEHRRGPDQNDRQKRWETILPSRKNSIDVRFQNHERHDGSQNQNRNPSTLVLHWCGIFDAADQKEISRAALLLGKRWMRFDQERITWLKDDIADFLFDPFSVSRPQQSRPRCGGFGIDRRESSFRLAGWCSRRRLRSYNDRATVC